MKTANRIGILGIGRLGEAIALAALALPEQGDVLVTERGAARVARLCARDSRVRPCAPQLILDGCDLIVIALRPEAANTLLPTLRFEPRHRIVSLMAEVDAEALRAMTPGVASISRVLAMPSVAQGGQLLPVFSPDAATEFLFGRHNRLLPVSSEQQLLTYWAITGLLSSVMTIGNVAERWLMEAGIERSQATAYARTLFSDVLAASADGLAEGLEHVSTPGGLNVMMRQQLLDAGFEDVLRHGLDGIRDRLAAAGARTRRDDA